MKPLLSLVMIVKDEAKNIRAVLEAVKPFVDRWTILDTGSTDGTQDIVRETMGDVPGRVFEEPFVDFAFSRNRVMALDALGYKVGEKDAPVAIFQLMLSADEYLCDGVKLREHLEEHRESKVDCHFLKLVIDDTRLYTPRIFRTGSAWTYEGVVHEIPVNRTEAEPARAGIQGAYIEHRVSDHERRFANIWDRHIPLLKAQLEENPKDERALIFLAQSYETLLPMMEPFEQTKYGMEAVALYMQRLAIPSGLEIERNWVRLHLLDCARLIGLYTDKELLERAVQLQKDDPQRPETAFLVARAAMKVLPVGKVYEAARHAAQVAEAAEDLDNSSPVSTSCGWRAHHFAAAIARQLAAKYPDQDTGDGFTWADRVREHVAGGVRAGGDWEFFQRFTETPVQQEASG